MCIIHPCEGNCLFTHGEHKKDIKKVKVIDNENGHDWGIFYYCSNAIEIDREHGFTVEILDE